MEKVKVVKSDPTPRSPASVSADPAYKVMGGYSSGIYYPSAAEIVVQHKSSKTFWMAVYAVRDDDSDYECGATWREVVPEATVRYVRKAKR